MTKYCRSCGNKLDQTTTGNWCHFCKAVNQTDELSANTEYLKPCPLCGSKAERLVIDGVGYDQIWCTGEDCVASIEGDSVEDATRCWNRRTTEKGEE